MGKLYTIDEKLLNEKPEIRIGEKVYTIDNSEKTVRKVIKLGEGGNDTENIDRMLELAFGKDSYKEISAQNLPFPALMGIFQTAVAAMVGEEPDTVSARFQGKNTSK